jgi:hypothetical protein
LLLRDSVISIPHSGTRSLADHLGRKAFYHFHQIELNKGVKIEGVIHIPVREPLEHAVSWVCFEGDLGNVKTSRAKKDGYFSFFTEFQLMVDFSQAYDVVFHRMEDLPRVAGFGPKGDSPLRKALKERNFEFLKQELPEFFKWIENEGIRAFYDRFYRERWYQDGADEVPEVRICG